LDLNDRVSQGEHVDSKDINKHKNDIFRLYQIIDQTYSIELNETIFGDVKEFYNMMNSEKSVNTTGIIPILNLLLD
jgi:hypothetical protein